MSSGRTAEGEEEVDICRGLPLTKGREVDECVEIDACRRHVGVIGACRS